MGSSYTILRAHIDELTPAQREIRDEIFFDGRTRAQIVERRGMSAPTYDKHLQPASRALRTGLMEMIEISTDLGRPSSYDRIELVNERHAAKQLRRPSWRKGKRSTSQHKRSSFQDEASTVPPERGTIAREGAASAALAGKSRGKRLKTEPE